MTTLTDLLKQTRELRAKATQDKNAFAPVQINVTGWGMSILHTDMYAPWIAKNNIDFIAHAANEIDKICRASEVMREALEEIASCNEHSRDPVPIANLAIKTSDEIAAGKE